MRLSELAAARAPARSDTRGDIDLVALDIERPGNDLGNSLCERGRGFTLVIVLVLNDREFVAAKTRQHVSFPKRRLEASRGLPQQRVADCVTERVVDMLETVKIQQQYGKWIATPAVRATASSIFSMIARRLASPVKTS